MKGMRGFDRERISALGRGPVRPPFFRGSNPNRLALPIIEFLVVPGIRSEMSVAVRPSLQ